MWSLIVVAVVSALMAPALVAQERKPVCDLFQEGDITAVAGTPIKQKVAPLGPDSCAWTGQRLLTIARMPDQPPEAIEGMLGVVARRAGEGSTIREVKGLGDRAIAETPTGGRRAEVWVASGRTMWRFTVDQIGTGTTPEELLGAVEKLAATALK